MTALAQTSWPDASIAIVGILFVAAATTVAIWQIFATAKARMAVSREQAYKRLAEEAVQVQSKTAEELARTSAELTQIRQQTGELERMLKEVE
jgi:uncharacterized protein YpmB